MKSIYSIGEFAKKTGTTIRTLHYYDEIGLLQPALTTTSGRRYYSDDNIIELQKIVSLKFLGYSLEQINELIFLKDWNLTDSLLFQKQEMVQKKAHIEIVIRALDHALLIMEEHGGIDSSVFISLINNIRLENEQKEWLKEIFHEDQIEEMYSLPEVKQQELNKKAAVTFSELKVAYSNGQDFDHNNVQKLIQDVFTISEEIYDDIFSFIKQIEELNNEVEDDPRLFPSPFSKEEEAWVSKAIEVYLIKKGVHFHENE
jgi:DNA-binding transcriptional MerR regulator